jgi:hypothetical protein
MPKLDYGSEESSDSNESESDVQTAWVFHLYMQMGSKMKLYAILISWFSQFALLIGA